MKRFLGPVLLVFLAATFFGCAGSSSYMVKQTTPPPAAPSPGKALVYFMRPSGMGFAINFQIYHGNDLIGLSQAKSYFTYECDPGPQMFLGMAENKIGLQADLEADKTYYVLTQVRMGAWKARMGIIPAKPDNEWWNKVDAYKTSLVYIAPDPAALQAWVEKNKGKMDATLAESYTFLNTPEGQKYVVHLGPEDGR